MSAASENDGAWSPFRHRAFALLWGAALLSNIGTWMHEVAAGWLMTRLAPSPAVVALVQAATTLPVFLLALPAGALADLVDRRRLLLAVQVAMLVVAAALGVLTLRGAVSAPLLLAFTFAIGLATAVHSPTWQAILPQLVPRADFPAAVALHSVGINVSRAIGPALGGALIVGLGIAWPFFLNAASFLAVIAALLWWRPAAPAAPAARTGYWRSVRIGLQQAKDNVTLRTTLLRSLVFFFFGSAYWALLPLIVRERLGGGARLYGGMVACIGVGAVAGALLLPRLRASQPAERIVLAGTGGTAAAIAVYALTTSPVLALLASLVAGAAWIASLSTLNVAAQLALPDPLRARGMALFSMVLYGSLALGSITWGLVAEASSISLALLAAVGVAVPATWLLARRLATGAS